MSHGMMQELQEREVEEHLAQLLRKLSTKDNSGERRSLRTKVRNKFPATKRLGRFMLVEARWMCVQFVYSQYICYEGWRMIQWCYIQGVIRWLHTPWLLKRLLTTNYVTKIWIISHWWYFIWTFKKSVSYFIVQLVTKLVIIYPDEFLSLFKF